MNYLKSEHYALCRRDVEEAHSVDMCKCAMIVATQCLYTAFILGSISSEQYMDAAQEINVLYHHHSQELISLMEEEDDD